jgi:hypothetical protein
MGHIASGEPDVRGMNAGKDQARAPHRKSKKEKRTLYMLRRARRVQKGFEMQGVSEEGERQTQYNTYMHVECMQKYKHEKLTAL